MAVFSNSLRSTKNIDYGEGNRDEQNISNCDIGMKEKEESNMNDSD